jgi:hypothetical protein
LRDERASKDPEDTSFAHAVSGNSLHNFVLENLFVYNEIAGIGRTPWRSMVNDTVSGSFDSHFPSQAQGRARSGRQRDAVFNQTEILPKLERAVAPASNEPNEQRGAEGRRDKWLDAIYRIK